MYSNILQNLHHISVIKLVHFAPAPGQQNWVVFYGFDFIDVEAAGSDEFAVLYWELVVESLEAIVWSKVWGLMLLVWWSCGRGWSIRAVVDWIYNTLLVDSSTLEELSDELLLTWIQPTHLLLLVLVELRGDIQRGLLKSLGIHIHFAVVNQKLDGVDALPETSSMQRIVKGARMLNLCTWLCEILYDLQVSVPGSEHDGRPVSITLSIQEPLDIRCSIGGVHCVPIQAGFLVVFHYFLHPFQIAWLAGVEQQSLLDLLALLKLLLLDVAYYWHLFYYLFG